MTKLFTVIDPDGDGIQDELPVDEIKSLLEYVSSTGDTMTGALKVPAGTVAAPGLAVGAADDGIYQIASGQLGFTFGGVLGLRTSVNGIGFGAGATASLAFNVFKPGGTAAFQLIGEISCAITLDRTTNDAFQPTYLARKSRGTVALRASVLTNDIFGSFSFQGYGDTAFQAAGQLRSQSVATTPSDTDMESRLQLLAPASGSVINTEISRFGHATGFSLFGANPVVNQNRHYRKRQYAAASLPSQASGDEIASSDIIAASLISDGTQWISPGVKVLNAVIANTNFSVPAGWAIDQIHFANTTANAVTGGIRIGTTAGGTEVVVAQAVGANVLDTIADANILKKVFSRTAAQSLFIQAVTSWNSASLELSFVLRKVY